HLLLGAAPFACGLEQAIDGFRNSRVAHEHALDRLYVARAGRADEFEIGRVGVNDAALRVRHQDALAGVIDDGGEQRTFGRPARPRSWTQAPATGARRAPRVRRWARACRARSWRGR